MPEMREIFLGVWKRGSRIFTENSVKGDRSFSPSLITAKGKEYREWDPNRSKPAAAIMRGLKEFPVKPGSDILYLGISSGTTASFFSDIIGPEGVIYGIEVSERSIRDLNFVAEKRENIVPILANARCPDAYMWVEKVDIVYQDVATNDQSEILIRNAERFLKPAGFAMMAIKARSINVIKPPQEIYKKELAKLRKHFKVFDQRELDPYEKDHCFVVMKKK